MLLTIAAVMPVCAEEQDEISVTLNGAKLVFDQPPVMMNNRVLVPFRKILEAMNVNVFYDTDKYEARMFSINCVKDNTHIVLFCEDGSYYEDGKDKWYMYKYRNFNFTVMQSIAMDVPPVILSGRTLVPIRVLAEAFGARVDWDGAAKTVIINADTSGRRLPDAEREAMENFAWEDARKIAEESGYQLNDVGEFLKLASYDKFGKYYKFPTLTETLAIRYNGEIERVAEALPPMITASIERTDSNIEYLEVSGHPDSAVEENLNIELFTFSTWAADDIDDLKFSFSIVGDFVSVRRTGMRYEEGAAYPVSFLHTQIFSLSTGEQAGSLSDYVKVGPELREVITSGAFKQVYPDGIEIEGAAERLASEIVDTYNFYLTETSLGIFIETLHTEGDYWVFEAPYPVIYPAVQTKLALELLSIYEN